MMTDMKLIPFPKAEKMDKDYAGLVDEALFECDLDLNLSAKVVEVKDIGTEVLCTIQCATMPDDGQLKSLLDELRVENGTECDITALDKKTGRIFVKILRK
jgi:hypothetical protein